MRAQVRPRRSAFRTVVRSGSRVAAQSGPSWPARSITRFGVRARLGPRARGRSRASPVSSGDCSARLGLPTKQPSLRHSTPASTPRPNPSPNFARLASLHSPPQSQDWLPPPLSLGGVWSVSGAHRPLGTHGCASVQRALTSQPTTNTPPPPTNRRPSPRRPPAGWPPSHVQGSYP